MERKASENEEGENWNKERSLKKIKFFLFLLFVCPETVNAL